MAVVGKVDGENAPAAFDLSPRFWEFVFTGFGAEVPIEQFSRNGLSSGAEVHGIASLTRAINAVLLGLPGFTTHGAVGGVRLNAEEP